MRSSMLAILRILGVIALAMAALVMPASAQDDEDDTQGDDVVREETEFAAYIYEGTMDDFAQDPVDEVGGLELLSEYDDDPDDEVEQIWNAIGEDGEDRPEPFHGDDADAELTLDALTGEPHVLVIHAGENTESPVIAAGNIEGNVDDGTLIIDLQGVNESGYEGRAFFGPDDPDDETSDDPESGDVEDLSGGEAGEGGADEGEGDGDDADDTDSETDLLIGIWQAQTNGA